MPKTVLVIEDNLEVRETVLIMLETLDYQAHGAEDGSSGIAAAKSLLPEIAIVDLKLPGDHSGPELIEILHQESPKTIMIITSGDAHSREYIGIQELDGVVAALEKPITLESLEGVLAKAEQQLS